MNWKKDLLTPSWANLHLALAAVMLTAANLSIAVSQLALALTLAVQLYRRFGRGEPLPGLGVGRWLLALALWAALMIPFSSDAGQSLVYYKRFYLFAALWVTAGAAVDGRRQWVLLGAVLTGAAAISVQGMLHVLRAGGSLFSMRVGEMSNPMTSGCLLMMSLLLAAGFLLTAPWRSRPFALVTAIALPVAVGLVQTMTRSAWLGAAAGFAVMLLLTRPRLFGVFTAVAVVLLLAVPRLPVGTLPASLQERFDPAYFLAGNSTNQRVMMWNEGWAMVRRHPLTGVGDRDLREIGPDYYSHPDMNYYGHLHSNPVMLAAIWGVPGLVLGMGFLGLQLVLLLKRWRILVGNRTRRGPAAGWILAALGLWTGFFIAGLTEWYFGDAESMLLYLALTGVALGLPLAKTVPGEVHV